MGHEKLRGGRQRIGPGHGEARGTAARPRWPSVRGSNGCKAPPPFSRWPAASRRRKRPHTAMRSCRPRRAARSTAGQFTGVAARIARGRPEADPRRCHVERAAAAGRTAGLTALLLFQISMAPGPASAGAISDGAPKRFPAAPDSRYPGSRSIHMSLQPVQAGRERLPHRHEQVPRKELAAVRVARQLQLVAGRSRHRRAARPVRQQHARAPPAAARRTCARCGSLACAASKWPAVKSVTPASTSALSNSSSSVCAPRTLRVCSTTCSLSSTFRPRRRSSSIQACAPAQYSWLPVTTKVPWRARRPASGAMCSRSSGTLPSTRSAGDRDGVGAEPVHRVDDALDVAAADRRAHVDVAELRDRETGRAPRAGHGSAPRPASRRPCGAH